MRVELAQCIKKYISVSGSRTEKLVPGSLLWDSGHVIFRICCVSFGVFQINTQLIAVIACQAVYLV